MKRLLWSVGWAVALGCATAAAADKPTVLDVWPGKPPGDAADVGPEKATADKKDPNVIQSITNVSHPTLTVYRPAKDKDTGAVVVIAPGGGYTNLAWAKEGVEPAEWLNSIGVTGVVLKYRVPRRPDNPKGEPPVQALMDAQRSISLVRSKAKEWGIDPNRIGMLGFSAGGHLTAWAATNFDKRAYEPIDDVDKVGCRPDFGVCIYPGGVIAQGQRCAESGNPRLEGDAADVPRPRRRRQGPGREQRRAVPGAEEGGRAGGAARLRVGRPRLRPAAQRQAVFHLAAALRRVDEGPGAAQDGRPLSARI